MNGFHCASMKNTQLPHVIMVEHSSVIKTSNNDISDEKTQHDTDLHAIKYQYDKAAQHIISTTPGGVDLQKKLKIVNDRGAELVVQYVQILPARNCVEVTTKMGVFTYTPKIIRANELVCLEAAVRQTTKGSLMFSMEGGCFVTDGIVPTLPAAERVSSTINEADHLLASLTYGVDHITWKKTTSPVSSYLNPLDVRCELLEAIGQMDMQLSSTESVTNKSQELSHAYSIYSKFSNVRPWPTLIMGNQAVAVASNGCIKLRGQLLKVDMRGLYTDWLGNQYYDDKADCCIEQKPFLIDFCQQHPLYLQNYPVLARLEEYAVVIGLCLADPQKPVGNKETHKAVISDSHVDYDNDVHEIIQRALLAEECLVQQEKNLTTRVFISLNLASSWLQQQKTKEAKDWSLLAILYLENMSSSDVPAVITKHLSAKAHLILASSLGFGSDPTAKIHVKLTDEEIEELDQLLVGSELEHICRDQAEEAEEAEEAKEGEEFEEIEQLLNGSELDHVSSDKAEETEKLEQFRVGLELQHASSDQGVLHRYGVRAVEVSLQQALAAGDWSTAFSAAEMILADFCYTAGLSEIPTHKNTAEQWVHWKTANYGGLSFPADKKPLLSIFNSMWPAVESAGEVECTNEALLSKFRNILPNAESITATDAEIQLTGFVHYLHAGICLKKKDTGPDALQQSLASSLHAICCFCKPFASSLQINWHILTASAALRLAKCCEALLEIEELESFKQRIEETAIKYKSMIQNHSTEHLQTVLQNSHNLRQFAQKYQFHELLVQTSEMMGMAYNISGDKEKALIWKRVHAVDCKNAQNNKKTGSDHEKCSLQ